MLIKIYSAAPVGIDAVPVTIEVHAVPGFDFTLVGLPDNAVKESHERILAALTVNNQETLHRAYTINMAPADIKKEGAAFDLPLAVGMLAGAEKLKTKELSHYMIFAAHCPSRSVHAKQASKDSSFRSRTQRKQRWWRDWKCMDSTT